jgi:Uma2 family endonuclease
MYGSARESMTVEEFERLPDDGWRQELVRGSVVREPPAGFEHGRTAAGAGYVLREYVRAHGLGEVCAAETGFILSHDPAIVRAPDAAFVAKSRVPTEPVRGFFPGAPDLAVEVLSPWNVTAAVAEKVADYLNAGTREVWVVDPVAHTVAVHGRADVMLLGDAAELDGGDVLPGFRVQIRDLFG